MARPLSRPPVASPTPWWQTLAVSGVRTVALPPGCLPAPETRTKGPAMRRLAAAILAGILLCGCGPTVTEMRCAEAAERGVPADPVWDC